MIKPVRPWSDSVRRFAVKPLLAMTVFVALSGFTSGLVVAADSTSAAKPLKALFLTGGGYHDYKALAPHLTTRIGELINATFEVRFGLDTLRDPKFADGFDVVVYDVCDDEAPDEYLANALAAAKAGKPSVMIHCAVHAFRKSPKISEWETLCGMRSKVHDRYGPFTVKKLDSTNPITKFFPDGWSTAGDELYQTISIDPKSRQLLKVTSPQDGREHIVSWTYQFGSGRVFATTLGHDMKTSATPEYLRLLANGLLWACDKLGADGQPAAGFGRVPAKP
jgi:type 1 glutamine amidotransferase